MKSPIGKVARYNWCGASMLGYPRDGGQYECKTCMLWRRAKQNVQEWKKSRTFNRFKRRDNYAI